MDVQRLPLGLQKQYCSIKVIAVTHASMNHRFYHCVPPPLPYLFKMSNNLLIPDASDSIKSEIASPSYFPTESGSVRKMCTRTQ